ncbi:MAG: hypothetical protein KBD64_03100 [Gammaproteobacteria bacterium]|nr:hypothetical protein [Gammaproteobacteria bacterium]
MRKLLIASILMVNISFAINSDIMKKYPFVLVGDDYGILNEQDMADDSYGLTVGYLNYNSSVNSGMHWKCYKTSGFSLRKLNFGFNNEWNEDVGDLELNMVDNNGIVNSYGMRRALGLSVIMSYVKIWEKLIKNQKYVCIHGHFIHKKTTQLNSKEPLIYDWIFNKLKTKKGCSGYFGCNK